MKNKDLIALLRRCNPDAEVVIYRDVESHGYGDIDKIKTGLFVETDYGNDFYPDTRLVIRPDEIHAVCIYSEEYAPPRSPKQKEQ